MDSKLRARVILCVFSVVLLVIGIVIYGNDKQNGGIALSQNNKTAMSETASGEGDALSEEYQLNPDKNPYAFLSDESFFDAEEEEKDQTPSLSILATSVQKDIRVFVVDETGKTVSGQKFQVTLEGTGKLKAPVYEDLDQDGMIYIAELNAGNYKVDLSAVKGYEVPKEGVSVSVKEDISYTVLDDITYLIKSEEEVNAAEEDTAVNTAEEDADGTETNKRLEDGASIFGIDVSKWNKQIDWKKVKDAGVEFAIIRCGYRGSKTGYLVEDPLFEQNIQGATDAGIRVGVYFFTQATNEVEAVEEASMVLMLCRKYKISYPLFIDTEGAGGKGRADGLDKETRTAVCRAFCETIENSGFRAGIYASKNWLVNNLDISSLEGYSVWLAQYSKEPDYQGDYEMWQYTSAGTVDGINGLVDFNLSYMEYQE